MDPSFRPGIKPAPLALEAWRLSHWTAREVPISSLWEKIYLLSVLAPSQLLLLL